MIRSFALAALLGSLATTGLYAQMAPPTSPAQPPAATSAVAPEPQNSEECLKSAMGLAQAAEDRKLGDEKLDRIDDLLTKMETHCDAKQFVEAMAVAKDIQAVIETR